MIKILIVEDEKDLLSVLVERFTEEKFSVEVARDGGEAVPAVNKFMPDIVLLDLSHIQFVLFFLYNMFS